MTIYTCKYCFHKSDKWLAYNMCCKDNKEMGTGNPIGIHYDAYGIRPVYVTEEYNSNIANVKIKERTWIHINDDFDTYLSDETRIVNGTLVKIPHGIAEGSTNIIHGWSGSGKTALVLYLIGLISSNGYSVIYNSTETPLQTLKNRFIDKLTNSFDKWNGEEIQDWYNLLDKIVNVQKPYLLVLDSLNDLRMKVSRNGIKKEATLLDKARHVLDYVHKNGVTLIVIMHENKGKQLKGDSEVLHEFDNIHVVKRLKGMSEICCEKGRDADRDATMKIKLIAGQGILKVEG